MISNTEVGKTQAQASPQLIEYARRVHSAFADLSALSQAVGDLIGEYDGTLDTAVSEVDQEMRTAVIDSLAGVEASLGHALAPLREAGKIADDLIGGADIRQAAHALVVKEDSRQAVVDALLEVADSRPSSDVGSTSFTANPDANQLLFDDPFAFLLGVLFDEQIPAERAWNAPYELKRRLGHLDPARMASDPDAVHRAINISPNLHRFTNLMPNAVSDAARRVTEEYGGDASRIWSDEPAAAELRRRLRAFKRIGQKKAAMTVEILERNMGVVITDMAGSDIAYDIHVRRVFLRTRLAQFDELEHMVDVAREANPDRPGRIDFPAWHIGRTWCRAGTPLCADCPLTSVCPKDVEAANAVHGL